jgi:hypothetical protein
MYKLLILLFLSLFSSCSSSITKKHKDINPAFEPYLTEIIEESKGKITKNTIKNLTMGFTNFNDISIVGHCNKIAYEIEIDLKYWTISSEERRLEIIMHEIGHCVLHRYHTNPKYEFWHDLPLDLGLVSNSGRLRDGCPTSVMHPYDMGWFCFTKHKEYYMDELFDRNSADKYNYMPWRW